jgi:hypothetical protein
MPPSAEIMEVRSLLEAAERQHDPELKAEELEDAFLLLESMDTGDMSPEDRTFVANLRKAHTRSLLLQLPSLLSVPFLVWFSYYRVLIKLRDETEALTAEDARLRENYERFSELWRQELADALKSR